MSITRSEVIHRSEVINIHRLEIKYSQVRFININMSGV